MLLHAVLFQSLVAASAARSQYGIAAFDTQRSLSGNISLAHLGLDYLPSASIDSTVSTHLDRRAGDCPAGTTPVRATAPLDRTRLAYAYNSAQMISIVPRPAISAVQIIWPAYAR